MTPSWEVLIWTAIALNILGYLWQTRTIKQKQSGEAVSVAWFASSVGLELVNLIYGWSQSDPLFITNAIICIVGQTLVLIVLKIYKPFGKHEWVVIAAITAVVLAAILLPFKNALQMTAQGINIYGGKDQPKQLNMGQGTGALELGALVLSGLSSAIWTTYCYHHFGLLGPALGYFVYTAYCGYMTSQWWKKSRSAKAS